MSGKAFAKNERIFIALSIPKSSNYAISDWLIQKWQKSSIRFVPEENRHITLRFIGSASAEQIAAAAQALQHSGAFLKNNNCQIGLCGLGFFPNMRRARVFWVGLADEKNFLSYAFGLLEKQLEDAGFEKESRPFHAHVTLARLNSPLQGWERDIILESREKVFGPSFKPSKLVLYKSDLKTSGASYTPLVEVSL